MKSYPKLIMLLCICYMSCKDNEIQMVNPDPDPPIAKVQPKTLITHGDERVDNYFWMRLSDEQKNADSLDQQTQDVISYLVEENAYKEAMMKDTDSLQTLLFNEIKNRIKKDESSVPVHKNGYSYYTRYESGNDYPYYCRNKQGDSTEEIILNGPKLAENHAYFGMGNRTVSPNNTLLAYGVDSISRRQYTIYFKDLNTGEVLADKLDNTTGNAVWASDNKTVFYTVRDPETLRASQTFKHIIGTNQSEDELVFNEEDNTFYTEVFKSKSDAYIFIRSWQTLSTEYRYLDANNPNGDWKIIQDRTPNLEYQVDHYGSDFYIKTNDKGAKNYKIVKTPVKATGKSNWVDVIPHREAVLIEDFDLFKDFLVVSERKEGLPNIRMIKWSGEEDQLEFKDPTYIAYTSSNLEFDTPVLRYVYTSLTTPQSTYEYNMNTKTQVLLKQEEVLDPNFKPEYYKSERVFATAKDSTQVPISIVYKKGITKNGSNPLLLYAYGSYGMNSDPYFNSSILSLLDRGFIFAIAHIRGGQELGRDWYENGKLLHKKNTFTDFIDCGEFLVENGYTSPEHLYAFGGSAGGLLMGAIVNMKPELWNGVIAAVPFVDVVSTMLDESIPLTTFEFDEWGNPKIPEYYDYIKSYSPYDNVEAKAYPNLLITTGYWDSQVQYWEPAKWIAKLRALKTDDNLLIMDCNMDVGHGGASGRFERYKQSALRYAFLLKLEDKL